MADEFGAEKINILKEIEKSGVVAVIRMNDTAKLEKVCHALSDGGIKTIEITLTIQNSFHVIKELTAKTGGEFIIGAGTVLNESDVTRAISAGAQFVVSPVMKQEVIKTAHNFDKVCICGGFSPSEILAAWENGADVVKVFPATSVGPQYIKDIHGPLPDIKLSPTGGVSLENTEEFIRMGASFVGVGTALTDKKMIEEQDWNALSNHANKFVEAVKRGRIENNE